MSLASGKNLMSLEKSQNHTGISSMLLKSNPLGQGQKIDLIKNPEDDEHIISREDLEDLFGDKTFDSNLADSNVYED